MNVGCYTTDLYCESGRDHPHAYLPHQFVGPNGRDTEKQARARGWKLQPSGGELCPRCNPQSRHYKRPE